MWKKKAISLVVLLVEAYDQIISGRVSARQKTLLKKSGYNVRDAVDFFLKYAAKKDKKLAIDKFFLEDEIQTMKNKISKDELECIKLEKKLQDINSELGVLNINDNEYDLRVLDAFSRIYQRYSIHKDKSNLPLGDFIMNNKVFIETQGAVCGMEYDNFIDGFVDYVENESKQTV